MRGKMEQNTKLHFHRKFEAHMDLWYEVEEEKEKFFGVYVSEHGIRSFITHRSSKRQACNLAQLLAETYLSGYNRGKELYDLR
jgi:hypothetical protein